MENFGRLRIEEDISNISCHLIDSLFLFFIVFDLPVQQCVRKVLLFNGFETFQEENCKMSDESKLKSFLTLGSLISFITLDIPWIFYLPNSKPNQSKASEILEKFCLKIFFSCGTTTSAIYMWSQLNSRILITYQLFRKTCCISTHWAMHSLNRWQFGVLSYHPLGHFSQRQQQSVPMFWIRLQSVSVYKRRRKLRLSLKLFLLMINYVDVATRLC